MISSHGPLARYVKLRVAHAPGMPGTFSPPPLISDPNMHHGTCETHVPWCMPGSLTSGFLWSRWRGKRSRHSRRMRTRNFAYLARGPWMPFSRYTGPLCGEFTGNPWIPRTMLILMFLSCRSTPAVKQQSNYRWFEATWRSCGVIVMGTEHLEFGHG